MTKLTLSLKKQWFDLLQSGVKPEEYRELKPFWAKRLCGKTFDSVEFTLGYPKADDTSRRMTFECNGIVVTTGNPEWGAEPGKEYFVIKLGKRIK